MKAREGVGKKYHSCDNNRKIRRRSTFPDNKDNVEEQENFCTDEQETGNGAKRPTQNANMGHTHKRNTQGYFQLSHIQMVWKSMWKLKQHDRKKENKKE